MSGAIRALKIKDVARQCGQSTRWVWARLKSDLTFPKPFYPSQHQPRWLEHEISGWLELQASRRGVPRQIRFDRTRTAIKESAPT